MELRSTAIIPHFDQQQAAIIDSISRAEEFLMSDDDYRFDHGIPLIDNFLIDDVMEEDPCTDFTGNSHFPDIHYPQHFENSNLNNEFPQNLSFGNPIKISTWPVVPSPYSCSCCQSLREFCHISGNHVLKLQVHGRLGMVSHAILHKYNNESVEDHEYHMLDFCRESMNNVKQFLVQYCNDRKREGYIMLHDPLSNFYDALCTGINGNSDLNTDNFQQDSPKGDESVSNRERSGSLLNKGYIALQRERTAKMTLKDLEEYFHLTMKEASKELNLCMSSIKAICRRGGLKRWPCRKVNSYLIEIAKKKQSLHSNDSSERARALMEEIHQLECELARYKDSLVSRERLRS